MYIRALQHIGIAFGRHSVHNDISFSVRAGEGLTILGPSGTGKTLILKIICGLLRPTSGEVSVLGTCLNQQTEEELVPLRGNIGMLFQGAALFDSLTVYENIAYPLREAGVRDERKISDVVASQLEVIGLPGVQDKYPQQLSGGQKKRVGLARALARSPKIVLFDEPTTGLDPTATRLIDDLIIKLRRDLGITTLAVTHDIQSAKRISDRWILVDSGVVVADGPVAEISARSEDVARFIAGDWKD